MGCFVDPEKGSKVAYSEGLEEHRTLMLLKNTDSGGKKVINHCIFADNGCSSVVCVKAKDANLAERVREGIAKSIRVFLDTLGNQNVDSETYIQAFAADTMYPVSVYTNHEPL